MSTRTLYRSLRSIAWSGWVHNLRGARDVLRTEGGPAHSRLVGAQDIILKGKAIESLDAWFDRWAPGQPYTGGSGWWWTVAALATRPSLNELLEEEETMSL